MSISFAWIAHLMLIAIRLSALFMFTPIQALRQLSIHTRMLLLFSLSILFIINNPNPILIDNLALRSSAEFIHGLSLALGLYAVFSIYQIAGQLIDNQLGINALAFFKPDEQGQESISARLLSMLAVLFFLGSNSHLWMFKGIAHSFIVIPPGSMPTFSGFLPIMKQFGFMFQMAFVLASPLIISLITLDFCCALVTRTMPQINTYFFVLPLKIVLGLIIFIGILPHLNSFTDYVMLHFIDTWQRLLS